MIIFRPIKSDDFKALHRIAVHSGHACTSLPVNDKSLQQRIAHTKKSFAKNALKPGNEAIYL